MHAPARDVRALCRHNQQCIDLNKMIRERLCREHITRVYDDIVGKSKLEDRDLIALGFAPDILRCFERPSDPSSFRYEPAAPGFQLQAESAALPVKALLLQLPQSSESLTIRLTL